MRQIRHPLFLENGGRCIAAKRGVPSSTSVSDEFGKPSDSHVMGDDDKGGVIHKKEKAVKFYEVLGLITAGLSLP